MRITLLSMNRFWVLLSICFFFHGSNINGVFRLAVVLLKKGLRHLEWGISLRIHNYHLSPCVPLVPKIAYSSRALWLFG